MRLAPISTISDMVAPVVLIITCASILGGLLAGHDSAKERLFAMSHERLDLLSGPKGELLDVASVPERDRERIAVIDAQLPIFLVRVQRIEKATALVYAAMALLVLGVIAIGLAGAADSDDLAWAALGLVLSGVAVLFVGIVGAVGLLIRAHAAASYEANRTRRLGLGGLNPSLDH